MIRFENVTFTYDGRAKVLDGADGILGPGLTLCLGLNGCGKSTLLKLAAGVEFPDAGRVVIDDHDLWRDEVEARRRLAYLPEHPDLTPYATIGDILGLVCRLRGEGPERGREALEAMGLSGLGGSSVRELSLGQKRRAVFASVLIGRPEHVFLDEPLEGMDRAIKAEILSWVERRVSEGASVVVVSHTIEPFVEGAARAVTVDKGKIRLVESLPASGPARLALLESMAKGQLQPKNS